MVLRGDGSSNSSAAVKSTRIAASARTKRRIFAYPANSAADLYNSCQIRDDELTAPLGARAHGRRLRNSDAFFFAVDLRLSRLAAFANVDAAFEVGAVFDGDAGRHYVAG